MAKAPIPDSKAINAVIKRLLQESVPSRWKMLALSFFCIIGVAAFTGALAYSTRLIVNDIFVAGDAQAAYRVAIIVVVVSPKR